MHIFCILSMKIYYYYYYLDLVEAVKVIPAHEGVGVELGSRASQTYSL